MYKSFYEEILFTEHRQHDEEFIKPSTTASVTKIRRMKMFGVPNNFNMTCRNSLH